MGMTVILLLLSAAAFIAAIFLIMTQGKRGLGVLSALGGVGLLLAAMVVIVPAGHVGVKVLFGKVSQSEFEEGLHLKNPFTIVQNLSIRTETYSMTTAGQDSISALSADGLQMPLDVTIAYRLVGDDAAWIYRNIGPGYEGKIIRTAARSAVREATAQYNAQEAYALKREALATTMEEVLERRVSRILGQAGLESGGFIIQQVLLRNVDLPNRVAAAIQEKLAAEQEAQRMDFVLEKERKEADRKRIEAQGVADFQKIVREGIDDQLLRWRGIEATRELAQSENAKIIVVGGKDGLPLILNTQQ